jgi:hypothetical protein
VNGLSFISKGTRANGYGDGIDFKAVEKIRNTLMEALDEEDLNIPIKIASLARKTRQIAHITKRGNQPFFERHILEPWEKEGFCKIFGDKREVVFLKLFSGSKLSS